MSDIYEKHIVQGIKERIKESGNADKQILLDLVSVTKQAIRNGDADNDYWWKITKYVKDVGQYMHLQTYKDYWGEIYDQTLLFEAPYLFESFMLYMEKNRPPEERFYQPRINPLRQVAQGIQDMADDKLDELFINLPSRTGKTQIVKFGFTWFGSRDPELSNLYTAFSDKITRGFYIGIQELINDKTYTYDEIFPEVKKHKIHTNGEDETIDLVRKKTYPTFTCRSIYGTLNGACDCSGLAVNDDLFSGYEEAISLDRQQTVWGLFDNNFMKRLKSKAKLISMGTRWALGDCQGRRLNLLENNPAFANRRYRKVIIPALDPVTDESNFDYPYFLGYSTEDYRRSRASFEENDDMASWFAQCQQEPVERQGALFNVDNMRFFKKDDLPDGIPDRVFCAVDIAFGGGDYVAMPICYQYEDEFYIVDVVFNNGDKFTTRPLIVDKVIEHNVTAIRFEETKATSEYRTWCENEWQKRGFRVNSQGKGYKLDTVQGQQASNLGKRIRIFDKAPEIKQMWFLKTEDRSLEYNQFMRNLFSFTMEGKVKHDDAPDSLAQLCDMKILGVGNTVSATFNPFRSRR